MRRLRNAAIGVLTLPARAAFHRASAAAPHFLGHAELDALRAVYPAPQPYGYDEESLLRRGRERAALLEDVLPDFPQRDRFLELGCADGMVTRELTRRGKHALGVDHSPAYFDRRATGLTLMNVAALAIADDSIDVVFSFNGFEHFARPDLVVAEGLRVLRSGGLLYLNFGPLYNSHFGLHAYRELPIPFCHFLFPPELLGNHAVDHEVLNGWSLAAFRRLWRNVASNVDVLQYDERQERYGLELVRRHPSCFRGKVDSFRELTTSTIEALFRKKEARA